MSNRRMFSNRIANSAKFLQMPLESQLLYFHFVLRADDDGIVESYPIIRLLNVPADSFRLLKAKGFIRELNEDQVIVITDWLEHNKIRADRKVDSIYKHLLVEKYPELPVIEPKPRSDVQDNSARVGSGQSTDGISQVKLSQVKLNIDSKSNKEIPIKDFKPKTYEENEMLKIASSLGETSMSFLVSVNNKGNFWAVQNAWGIFRELDKSKIDNPPAYFNKLVEKELVK